MTAVSTTGNKSATANADPITALVNTIQGYFAGAGPAGPPLVLQRGAQSFRWCSSPARRRGRSPASVDAVDPEGDHLAYKVTQQAHYGTVADQLRRHVHLHADARWPMQQHLHRLVRRRRDRHRTAHQSAQLVPDIQHLGRRRYLSAAGRDAKRITFTFVYGNGSQFWVERGTSRVGGDGDLSIELLRPRA